MNHSGSNSFDSIVGTMNERLSPAYMVDLAIQTSVSLLGFTSWNGPSLLDMWLRDALACTHTDLIHFARGKPPMLFCFSPFESRPLGKALPNLLMSCKCGTPIAEGATSRRRQKVWQVRKTGKNGTPLSKVVVTAICTACEQTWKMSEPGLAGRLVKASGLYAAEVPYFGHELNQM